MLQASSDYLDSQETPAGGEAQKLGKIQCIVTIITKKKNKENNLEIIECLNPKAINRMFETISSIKVTICNLNGQLVAFFLGYGWVPPIS